MNYNILSTILMLNIELEEVEIENDDFSGEDIEEYLNRTEEKYKKKKKSKPKDKCYICLSKHNRKNMIYPCSICKKPIHKDCVQSQLDYDKRCGNCRTDLPILENKKFNTKNCCKDTWWCISGIILNIINIGIICLMALGLSLLEWINGNYEHADYIGFIFLSIFPFIITIQFPPCCYYHIFPCFRLQNLFKNYCNIQLNENEIDDNETNESSLICSHTKMRKHIGKSYLTIIIIIFFECCVLLLAHGIGYPIMIYLFNENKFFTWPTCLAGLSVLYIIIIGGSLIITPIYWTIKYIIKSYTDTERTILN